MSDTSYAYAYPGRQGYYQAPPVMAAPQVPVMAPPQVLVIAPPFHLTPPPRKPGLFDSCLAVFCCIGRCCCDPNNLAADGSSVPVCDPNTWFASVWDPNTWFASVWDPNTWFASICDPNTWFP